jgi:hypothetical protein
LRPTEGTSAQLRELAASIRQRHRLSSAMNFSVGRDSIVNIISIVRLNHSQFNQGAAP